MDVTDSTTFPLERLVNIIKMHRQCSLLGKMLGSGLDCGLLRIMLLVCCDCRLR